MEWIVLFLVSWILFIILVNWKKLKLNIWCGVLAVVLQLSIDSQAMSHKLYKIDNQVIGIWGSSLFFVFGPVLVVGILLAQYHPVKKWFKLINIFVISGLYSLQEALLILMKELIYTNWHFINSIVVNITAVTVLSWFSIVILNKGEILKQ